MKYLILALTLLIVGCSCTTAPSSGSDELSQSDVEQCEDYWTTVYILNSAGAIEWQHSYKQTFKEVLGFVYGTPEVRAFDADWTQYEGLPEVVESLKNTGTYKFEMEPLPDTVYGYTVVYRCN